MIKQLLAPMPAMHIKSQKLSHLTMTNDYNYEHILTLSVRGPN